MPTVPMVCRHAPSGADARDHASSGRELVSCLPTGQDMLNYLEGERVCGFAAELLELIHIEDQLLRRRRVRRTLGRLTRRE